LVSVSVADTALKEATTHAVNKKSVTIALPSLRRRMFEGKPRPAMT
jgi:hypothetical protein